MSTSYLIDEKEEEQRVVWNSENVAEISEKIQMGYKIKEHPFWSGKTGWRKADIAFEYTAEELSEYDKCKNDILYFANNYCYLMTDEGRRRITLRDYQSELVLKYKNHRFNVVLASRQSGKCLPFYSKLTVEYPDGDKKYISIGELYFDELFRSGDYTFKDEEVYKILKELFIDEIDVHSNEYKKLSSYFGTQETNEDLEKIQNSLDLKGVKVLSDEGFVPISQVHITKSFNVYRLKTESGKTLDCADHHLIFTSNTDYKRLEDLSVGEYVMTKDGRERVVSIDNLKRSVPMFDISVDTAKHAYYSDDILSHNTSSANIFLAWYVLFHFDKNLLVVANKGKTVTEIISKTKDVIKHLPFFLKPGVITNNQQIVAFDNGSRLIGETASKNPAIGFTIHAIYADEFAHIEPGIVESYYTSIYPTLSASKYGKMIITSTANGFNKFQEIYHGAVDGENEFIPTRIDWWQVPGRDINWMMEEIANLGSQEAFDQEYGNSFDTSTSILFSPLQLKMIKKTLAPHVHHEFDILDAWECKYENLVWNKKFDVEETLNPNKFFIIGVDAAEGSGGKSDKTVITIWQIVPLPKIYIDKLKAPTNIFDFFGLKQIATLEDNELKPKETAKILYLLMYKIFNPNNIKASVEYNNYGREILGYMETVCEPINEYGDESVVNFPHRVDAKWKKPGIKLMGWNRENYLLTMKQHHLDGKLFIAYEPLFEELQVFGKNKSGKYEAITGKDDNVMSASAAVNVIGTMDFKEFCEQYFDVLPDSKRKEIIDKLNKTPNVDVELSDGRYDVSIADLYIF